MALAMDWVQGNVVPGFHKDFQDFVFVRFDKASPGPARQWLSGVLPNVQASSAREVARFNRAFKAHRSRGAFPPTPTAWANIAFSRQGLEALGVPGWKTFPDDFLAAPTRRARGLWRDDNATWLWGGLDDAEHDAVLILGADSLEALEDARRKSGVDDGRVAVMAAYRGATLGGGREHFGFRDGISQPVPDVLEETGTWPVDGQYVEPSKFVLQPGHMRGEPAWARNGSYAVFCRFVQDVDAFAQEMTRNAVTLVQDGIHHMTPDLLKAKVMGRWTDGTPLVDDYRGDPNGQICPLFAHTRKAFPRYNTDAAPEEHRIIRRGIPFASSKDGKVERGMLFLAFQANISMQFAHVFGKWLNGQFFPQAPRQELLAHHGSGGTSPLRMPGVDPVTSTEKGTWLLHRPGSRTFSDGENDYAAFEMQRFVTLTALGYFFAPSIRALQTVRQFTH